MKWLFILIETILFLSCTRNTEPSSAKIEFGSISAQSIGNIRVLIINVSGPNMPRQVFQWSCPEEECTTADVPQVVEMEIPKGTKRLFQAIIAGENSATNAVQFNYDDKEVDLFSENSNIQLVPVMIGSGGSKFDFGGRYSVDGTNFYSGWIDMIYQPPGKPSMVIESNYMFAGWFQFFGIDGAGFSYVKRDSGEVLFSNVGLSTLDCSSSPFCMKVLKPSYKYLDNSTCYLSAKEYLIYGFYGNSSWKTGKSAKYMTHNGIETGGRWQYDHVCTTGNAYQWKTNIPDTDRDAHVSEGGVGEVSFPGICDNTATGSMLFDDCLKYYHTGIQSGKKYEFGFHGPFKVVDDTGFFKFLIVKHDQSVGGGLTYDIEIQFSLLPDTYNNGSISGPIQGVDLFYQTGYDYISNHLDSEDISCEDLVTDTDFVIYPHQNSNISGYSADFAILDVAPVSGVSLSTLVIACPFQTTSSGKSYYNGYATIGYDQTM